jgi:hypothetical protein
MTTENGLYDPIAVGEVAELLDEFLYRTGLLSSALRVIVKELPLELDAARLAAMSLDCCTQMESCADHALERLKNGGLL